MKYAVEVAKAGSLSKASEVLLIAQPNLSRSVKELEADLGITIFERTAKGMTLTAEGEEFISYARQILMQIDQVERIYREGSLRKRKFTIAVPRACYISEAFSCFSDDLGEEPVEVFYKETNSKRTIDYVLNHDYKLGIIRYAANYDKHFREMLEEKGLSYEMVSEFTYRLIMSSRSPLAGKDTVTFDDLAGHIEIAHADPYVPSLPLSRVMKEELPDNTDRRIYVFERASQLDLLSENPDTFMWVSPTPDKVLERYDLVQRSCAENKRVYKDVLIYKKGYKLTDLDQKFVSALIQSRRKYV